MSDADIKTCTDVIEAYESGRSVGVWAERDADEAVRQLEEAGICPADVMG